MKSVPVGERCAESRKTLRVQSAAGSDRRIKINQHGVLIRGQRGLQGERLRHGLLDARVHSIEVRPSRAPDLTNVPLVT